MKFIITTLLVCMSYLNLNAKVTIGDIYFPSINSFEVEQSVDNTSDIAKITLARNYKELRGSKVLDYIRAGKPVTIECGYNGVLETEFTGFIKPNIGADYPIILECDELYFLRQNNHIISESNITLKQLLQRIAPAYTIEALDVQLGKVRFSNESTVQILEKLKKDWGFYSRIHNNILHVGFAFDFKPSFTQRHTYTIGQNVKDYSKLKFTTDMDFSTQVKVKIHKANGHVEEIVYGMKEVAGTMQAVKIGGGKDDKVKDEKGTIKTYDVSHIGTTEAENMAKAQLKRIIYSGYTGSIDGFGNPRTKAGDSLQIINTAKPEREGTYLIEKVVVRYEEAHIERENFISYKVA
jgi:hypothetical protein